jgi:hypothetical protein
MDTVADHDYEAGPLLYPDAAITVLPATTMIALVNQLISVTQQATISDLDKYNALQILSRRLTTPGRPPGAGTV